MGFPTWVGGIEMPTAILDERGRVVLPKELADELGVSKGDVVVFERKGKDFVVMRASSKKERLEEVMDWNPERTGKPEVTSPKDMKGIWKT
jgi:AbrB family looped-hinge helix DNA binding protein